MKTENKPSHTPELGSNASSEGKMKTYRYHYLGYLGEMTYVDAPNKRAAIRTVQADRDAWRIGYGEFGNRIRICPSLRDIAERMLPGRGYPLYDEEEELEVQSHEKI